MPTTPEQRLVNDSRKMGALLAKGLVTPQGAARHILGSLALAGRVEPGFAPEVWSAVPDAVRPSFAGAVREVLRPGYEFRHFGFGDTRTPEQREADVVTHTTRLRAWAAEFARLWDAGARSS